MQVVATLLCAISPPHRVRFCCRNGLIKKSVVVMGVSEPLVCRLRIINYQPSSDLFDNFRCLETCRCRSGILSWSFSMIRLESVVLTASSHDNVVCLGLVVAEDPVDVATSCIKVQRARNISSTLLDYYYIFALSLIIGHQAHIFLLTVPPLMNH